MATGTQTQRLIDANTPADMTPDISVCETCPGTSVFLEAGNTDGWIATDSTVDLIL